LKLAPVNNSSGINKAVKNLPKADYDECIRELLSSGQIKEREDTHSVSYLLSDDDLFYFTGYKVLQGQHQHGILKCAKVLQNGKIKLVYDIEGLKSLQTVIPVLTSSMFLTIIYNHIDVFKEIRHNGFIHCENVCVSPDRIYIDPGNLRVFLLYLPLNTQTSPDSILIFENRIKKVILDLLFYNPHINNNETQEIRKEIFSNKDTALESLQENLSSMGHPIPTAIDLIAWVGGSDGHTDGDLNEKGNSRPLAPNQLRATRAHDNLRYDATIRRHPFFISKLLGRGMKTAPVANLPPGVIKWELSSYGEFSPQIALASQNVSESMIFIINKPVFIIGKDAKAVDGVIISNPFVSSAHCKIVWDKSRYYIVDMESLNQTFLNDAPLSPNALYPLQIGDIVRLANVEFILQPLSEVKALDNTAPDLDTDPNMN
jgi:hypothetical protein